MKNFSIAMALSCCLFACGGSSSNNGVATLNTATVTATGDVLVLDSDVASWVDAVTGVKATACAATSVPNIPASDTVNITVSAKPYSNTGSAALPIRVENVTVSYAAANSTTPSMASEFQAVGQVIQPGGSLTIPVRVVSQEQKQRLQASLDCVGTIYNYYVTIFVDVTEIGTNAGSQINSKMQLRLADFIDK